MNKELRIENIWRNAEVLKIGGLYFFLLAGGLWHVIGVFQTVMRTSAGAVISGLALWVAWEVWQLFADSGIRRKYAVWCSAVVLTTFWIEFAGVHTGEIFGSYEYGATLQPQIGSVPVAIGFAWLVMLISSVAVAQRLLPQKWLANLPLFAGAIGVLMVLFDAVMEPAAIRLNYWHWFGAAVPLKNYLAWFVVSAIFAGIAFRWQLFRQSLPKIAFHAYVAQLLYFAMVLFA